MPMPLTPERLAEIKLLAAMLGHEQSAPIAIVDELLTAYEQQTQRMRELEERLEHLHKLATDFIEAHKKFLDEVEVLNSKHGGLGGLDCARLIGQVKKELEIVTLRQERDRLRAALTAIAADGCRMPWAMTCNRTSGGEPWCEGCLAQQALGAGGVSITT